MAKRLFITKAAGESEAFSADKLRKSMAKTGASYRIINRVIDQVKKQTKPGDSTSRVYQLAFHLLKQSSKTYAARYGLKKAIMHLGPDGFPFEEYLADLFEHYGYQCYTNQIFAGACITHEVDVVAEKPKDNIHAIIEAKFHGQPGRKTGSKDAMYTHARFLDINNTWVAKRKRGAKPQTGELQNWLVTNTEVTSEAQKYAKCVGMKIISWSSPKNKSLQDLIRYEGLYPITILLTLNRNQKRQLLRRDIVMCKDILKNKDKIKKLLYLDQNKLNQLEAEVSALIGQEIPL